MITVYFENNVFTMEVATFKNEEIYNACLPSLKETALDMGFTHVTETTDEEKEDDNSCEQT